MIMQANQVAAPDTTELIARCLKGDQRAWNALIDRYGRLVNSIPRQYGLCQPDADDVFQNVFTLLHRRMATIRDRQRLTSWLITTTHRECWRVRRRQARERSLTDQSMDPHEPAPELAARWERQQIVREALNRLPARDRALMTALFLEQDNPDYSAIARRLGMKVGSVGPTRARCFKKLEQILIDMGVESSLRDPAAPAPLRPSHDAQRLSVNKTLHTFSSPPCRHRVHDCRPAPDLERSCA